MGWVEVSYFSRKRRKAINNLQRDIPIAPPIIRERARKLSSNGLWNFQGICQRLDQPIRVPEAQTRILTMQPSNLFFKFSVGFFQSRPYRGIEKALGTPFFPKETMSKKGCSPVVSDQVAPQSIYLISRAFCHSIEQAWL